MTGASPPRFVTLDTRFPIWERVFTVNSLVLVGTKEATGEYDLAPKHMVTPLGLDNYFGFVCTPRHRTYHNAKREREFTVSYLRPAQVVAASFAAAPRCDDDSKPTVGALDTVAASEVDALLLSDAYLHLECALDRVVEDLGDNSLVIGRVLRAQARPGALRSPDRDESDLIRDLPMLVYLHPGRYCKIGETHAFPYSQDLGGPES